MRFLLKLAIVLFLPTAVYAEPGLHRGSVGFVIDSYDGDQTILGSIRSYDGDITDFNAEYFLGEKFSVSLSKGSGDLNYGAIADNLTCDIDGTAISAAIHPSRVNYFTGEGSGFNFGVSSIDVDAECEDDFYYYNTVSTKGEDVNIELARGLGNGLVFEFGMSSDTDDFLDDLAIGFRVTKTFEGGFALNFGMEVSETAEDADGDNAELTSIGFGAGFLF